MRRNYMRPNARAIIKGGKEFPEIVGEVLFYQVKCAVIVNVRVFGLNKDKSMFYAFHIHEGNYCYPLDFSNTQGHYNPEDKPHPFHAGDLPPLLSCCGEAYIEFKTCRFSVNEIIGKTVIIHSGTDDFRSQPSGDSKEKIACGEIKRV